LLWFLSNANTVGTTSLVPLLTYKLGSTDRKWKYGKYERTAN
jgi:hypothetical protein